MMHRVCPCCESNNVRASSGPFFDNRGCDVEMVCEDCGSEWALYYTFAGAEITYHEREEG